MGYGIAIGNAEVEVDYENRSARMGVKSLDGKSWGAPVGPAPYANPTGHSWGNNIAQGYCLWSAFCERVGMERVFFGSKEDRMWKHWTVPWNHCCHDALFTSHPGCEPLDEDHLRMFKEVRDGFFPHSKQTPTDIKDICRLDWLVWWTDWALKNSEYPSIYNG